MEEGKLTYFDMAENDYLYLQHDFETGRVGNLICYASQSICERYLKHVVSIGCREQDTTRILKTHSLKALVAFIEDNMPDFTCEWNSVLLADGYYFSARYPGEDALFVKRRDVENCRRAVEVTREAVNAYINAMQASDFGKAERNVYIESDDDVMESLEEFSRGPHMGM